MVTEPQRSKFRGFALAGLASLMVSLAVARPFGHGMAALLRGIATNEFSMALALVLACLALWASFLLFSSPGRAGRRYYNKLVDTARKLRARDAKDVIAHDSGPLILYLRSFEHDEPETMGVGENAELDMVRGVSRSRDRRYRTEDVCYLQPPGRLMESGALVRSRAFFLQPVPYG